MPPLPLFHVHIYYSACSLAISVSLVVKFVRNWQLKIWNWEMLRYAYKCSFWCCYISKSWHSEVFSSTYRFVEKKMYVKWQFKIQNWEVSGFASKVQVWNCNVSKCSHLEISTCLVPQGCAEKSIERGRQHRLLDNQSSETGFLFWFNPIWNMVFQERDHSWEVRWWSGHWLCWRSCHGSNLLRSNFFARLSNTSFQLDAVWMTR